MITPSYKRELFESMQDLLTFLTRNNIKKENIVTIMPYQTSSCDSEAQLSREYELIYLSFRTEEPKFHADELVVFEEMICRVEEVYINIEDKYRYKIREVVENPIVPRIVSTYDVEENKLTKYSRGGKL